MGVYLKVTDSALDAGRVDGDRIADLHLTFDQGAGDDGAEAFYREDTVDRNTERNIQVFDLGLLVDQLEDSLF